MIFVDVPFPECIGFGAESSGTWDTSVAAVLGGNEDTNQNWEDARHEFNVPFAPRPADEWILIRDHHHTMRGRAKSFPVKDFLDFSVTVANGVLIDDDGAAPTASGTFQLAKQYGSGSEAYKRRITRPDTPVHVFRTRSAVTTDITGAGAAVTYTTGAVVITGHVGGDTYTWSGTFKVPCRYDSDKLPGVAVNKNDGELVVECGPIAIIEVRE